MLCRAVLQPRKHIARNAWLPRFKKLTDALAANPKIKVTKLEIAKPAAASKIAKVRKQWKLEAKVLQLWSEANGVELRWEERDSDCGRRGSISLRPLEEVFGDW